MGILKYAFPMVSFCDIPMSELKSHIKNYGRYGLGLKKTWAQKNGLNPVLYVEKSSIICKNFHKAFDTLFVGKQFKHMTETDKQLADVIRYMKNYEGVLNRQNMEPKNYRFADEKEWRYVPSYDKAWMAYRSDLYTKDKDNINSEISNLVLKFDLDDVNYIIINDETEIHEFIEILRKLKGDDYPLSKVEKVISRIITAEQIDTDF